MTGLFNWDPKQMNAKLAGKSDAQKEKIMNVHKRVFNDIMEASGITDTNSEIHYGFGTNPDLNCNNPYSRITCFLLMLYSMEFGTPALYADLNRAARELDMSKIDDLGGYAMVLYEITKLAESKRSKGDYIPTGEDIYIK